VVHVKCCKDRTVGKKTDKGDRMDVEEEVLTTRRVQECRELRWEKIKIKKKKQEEW
jgi:hypothetical protein